MLALCGLAYDHWLCRWITQFATIADNLIWTLCDDLKKWQARDFFSFWNDSKKVVLTINVEGKKTQTHEFISRIYFLNSKNGKLNNGLNEPMRSIDLNELKLCDVLWQQQQQQRKKSMSSSCISDPLKKPTKCQAIQPEVETADRLTGIVLCRFSIAHFVRCGRHMWTKRWKTV